MEVARSVRTTEALENRATPSTTGSSPDRRSLRPLQSRDDLSRRAIPITRSSARRSTASSRRHLRVLAYSDPRALSLGQMVEMALEVDTRPRPVSTCDDRLYHSAKYSHRAATSPPEDALTPDERDSSLASAPLRRPATQPLLTMRRSATSARRAATESAVLAEAADIRSRLRASARGSAVKSRHSSGASARRRASRARPPARDAAELRVIERVRRVALGVIRLGAAGRQEHEGRPRCSRSPW